MTQLIQENLIKYRKKKGLSKLGLEKKSGVTRNTIHSIECGVHEPTIKTLQKLSNALDITVADLIEK